MCLRKRKKTNVATDKWTKGWVEGMSSIPSFTQQKQQ